MSGVGKRGVGRWALGVSGSSSLVWGMGVSAVLLLCALPTVRETFEAVPQNKTVPALVTKRVDTDEILLATNLHELSFSSFPTPILPTLKKRIQHTPEKRSNKFSVGAKSVVLGVRRTRGGTPPSAEFIPASNHATPYQHPTPNTQHPDSQTSTPDTQSPPDYYIAPVIPEEEVSSEVKPPACRYVMDKIAVGETDEPLTEIETDSGESNPINSELIPEKKGAATVVTRTFPEISFCIATGLLFALSPAPSAHAQSVLQQLEREVSDIATKTRAAVVTIEQLPFLTTDLIGTVVPTSVSGLVMPNFTVPGLDSVQDAELYSLKVQLQDAAAKLIKARDELDTEQRRFTDKAPIIVDKKEGVKIAQARVDSLQKKPCLHSDEK